MSRPASPRARPQAGDVLLHPVVVSAIGILLLNDHVLKARFPGAVTGILSDLSGLIFFPLLLVATLELLRRRVGGAATIAVCVVVTGLVFAGAELAPALRVALEDAWGWSRTAIGGGGHAVAFTPDPTDLLALPALLVPWVVGRRRAARIRERSGV